MSLDTLRVPLRTSNLGETGGVGTAPAAWSLSLTGHQCRTLLSPNGHQQQWMAWTARTAVTMAPLLHLPQGAEHPLKGLQRFATFPGPDEEDVEPSPLGEGAVPLGLTSSSPKMHGAAAASSRAVQLRGISRMGGGQPRDYTSCTSTAHGLGATPAPPPGLGTSPPHDPVWGLIPSSPAPVPTKTLPFPLAPVQL